MDDDQWRADGSFRGMAGGGGSGKGKGGKGGGGGNPQFTRVIPKFLRKFQQPPEIQAKFAPPAMPDDGGDADDHELDDVQRAAIDEYLAEQESKKQKKEEEEAAKRKDAEEATDAVIKGDADGKEEHRAARRKKVMQSVAELGKTGKDAAKGKKRKRLGAAPAKLSNKKLLSFSMDDEE